MSEVREGFDLQEYLTKGVEGVVSDALHALCQLSLIHI